MGCHETFLEKETFLRSVGCVVFLLWSWNLRGCRVGSAVTILILLEPSQSKSDEIQIENKSWRQWLGPESGHAWWVHPWPFCLLTQFPSKFPPSLNQLAQVFCLMQLEWQTPAASPARNTSTHPHRLATISFSFKTQFMHQSSMSLFWLSRLRGNWPFLYFPPLYSVHICIIAPKLP